MDHEVVLRPSKIDDWLLNSSWDRFGLHQGETVIMTMEFEVPERQILSMQYPLTWSNGFAVGEAYEVL